MSPGLWSVLQQAQSRWDFVCMCVELVEALAKYISYFSLVSSSILLSLHTAHYQF